MKEFIIVVVAALLAAGTAMAGAPEFRSLIITAYPVEQTQSWALAVVVAMLATTVIVGASACLGKHAVEVDEA